MLLTKMFSKSDIDEEENLVRPTADLIQAPILSGDREYSVSVFLTIYLRREDEKGELKNSEKIQKSLYGLYSIPSSQSFISAFPSDSKIQLLIGIEPSIWKNWCSAKESKTPKVLFSFQEKVSQQSITGLHTSVLPNQSQNDGETGQNEDEKLRFPATGGDLLFYIKATSIDLCWSLTKIIIETIGPENILKKVQHFGFSHGGRDLTGFIDGTRNPKLPFNILDSAIIHQDDDPINAESTTTAQSSSPSGVLSNHVGGSYVLASRFIHNLSLFHTLTNRQKSVLVGRDYEVSERGSNPRLSDTFQHLALTQSQTNAQGRTIVTEGDGSRLDDEEVLANKEKKQVLEHRTNYHVNKAYGLMTRQSWPYAFAAEDGAEEGLLFLAFSRNLRELDHALDRMLGIGSPYPFQVDNLLLVSKPVATNYFYSPSILQLKNLSLY